MSTIKELIDNTNYGIVEREVGPWVVYGSEVHNPPVCHTLGDARMEILSRGKDFGSDLIFRKEEDGETYTNQNGKYFAIKRFSPGQFMTNGVA